ncbi:MAG: ABC transporter permease [Kofleriaceae bacterium]
MTEDPIPNSRVIEMATLPVRRRSIPRVVLRWIGFIVAFLALAGLAISSLLGAIHGTGAGFTPLLLFTHIALGGAVLWLFGGMVGADTPVKERSAGFALRAQIGPLYAELRPGAIVDVFQIFGLVLVSMVQLDRWGEVFDTIRRNKLRTVLTCVSVAWGIFVMVVLLGMGQGLNNGIRQSFKKESANAVYISASKTSIPWAGYNIGRKITFNNRDYDAALSVEGISHLGKQFFIHGGRFGGGEMKTQRGTKSNAFGVNAINPATYYLDTLQLAEGRYINAEDVRLRRKTAVIGEPVRDYLFGHNTSTDAGDGGVDDPIGEWIVVGGVAFQVVGVYHDDNEESARQIYIPVSTAQLAFNGADRLGMVMFDVMPGTTIEEEGKIKRQIIEILAASHQFSPDDKQAVRVFDNIEGFSRFQQFFTVISLFVVVIGLGTLAAGVVGVSNIMMIAVKERTKEIGVRKALGATPRSIIAMIVQEAVFLTSVAGLLGLSAGVVVLGAMSKFVHTEMIQNPSINISTGIAAAIGLVIAGALAGFVPAKSAAQVNPIQTLRDQ